jgi:hypothetical protein
VSPCNKSAVDLQLQGMYIERARGTSIAIVNCGGSMVLKRKCIVRAVWVGNVL